MIVNKCAYLERALDTNKVVMFEWNEFPTVLSVITGRTRWVTILSSAISFKSKVISDWSVFMHLNTRVSRHIVSYVQCLCIFIGENFVF